MCLPKPGALVANVDRARKSCDIEVAGAQIPPDAPQQRRARSSSPSGQVEKNV
jgi:hypothetical protein